MLQKGVQVFEFSITNKQLFDIMPNMLNYVKYLYEQKNIDNCYIESVEKVIKINNILCVIEDNYDSLNVSVLCEVIINNYQINDLMLVNLEQFDLVNMQEGQYGIYIKKENRSIIQIDNIDSNPTKYKLIIINKIDHIINSPTFICMAEEFVSSKKVFPIKYAVGDVSSIVVNIDSDMFYSLDSNILKDFNYEKSIQLPKPTSDLYMYDPIKNKWYISDKKIEQSIADFSDIYFFAIRWHIYLFSSLEIIKKNNPQLYKLILSKQ